MNNNFDNLTVLMERFLSGEEQSQGFVRGDIGGFLESAFPHGEGFPDADLYEDLDVAIACYRPGGGQFMYDERQVADVFRAVLRRLGTNEG